MCPDIRVNTWLSDYIKRQIIISPGPPPFVDSAGSLNLIIWVSILLIVSLGTLVCISPLSPGKTRVAEENLRRFRKTVYNYIRKREQPFRYLSRAVTYTCFVDGKDVANIQSVIEAKELFEITQTIGVLPATTVPLRRPEFEDIGFWTDTDSGKRVDAEVVDATYPDRFLVALFFDPPIGGDTPADRKRTVSYSYTWKGLWNDLRRRNYDHGEIRASTEIGELTLTLKFPPKETFGKVELSGRIPPVGSVQEWTDESNWQVITWKIGKAEKDKKFEYQIERKPI